MTRSGSRTPRRGPATSRSRAMPTVARNRVPSTRTESTRSAVANITFVDFTIGDWEQWCLPGPGRRRRGLLLGRHGCGAAQHDGDPGSVYRVQPRSSRRPRPGERHPPVASGARDSGLDAAIGRPASASTRPPKQPDFCLPPLHHDEQARDGAEPDVPALGSLRAAVGEGLADHVVPLRPAGVYLHRRGRRPQVSTTRSRDPISMKSLTAVIAVRVGDRVAMSSAHGSRAAKRGRVSSRTEEHAGSAYA